ncbi:multicopper oxidase domain-containing protein [Kutzneria sp. NPDC051319]|uniref:multicopper oxidase domain-containing protein n=1 Tax=Kutzneria sp. NPDC051319 TaxID=3155047 RepID=UPI0034199333
MRDSSVHPRYGPPPDHGEDRGATAFPTSPSYLLLTAVLAVGTAFWQHWALADDLGAWDQRLPYFALDVLLALPVAGIATWFGAAAVGRLRQLAAFWERPVRAAAVAIAMTVLSVPLVVAQAVAHTVLGDRGALDNGDLGRVLDGAWTQALQLEVAVLVLATVGVLVADGSPKALRAVWGPPSPRRGLPRPAMASVLVASMIAVPGVVGAAPTTAAPAGGCATAPQRVFNVSAIDVDIVVDRFGDHDPYGYMYVLAEQEKAVRDQEAALLRASALPKDDPSAAKVSFGLGEDPIQPLVMRARLGECVVVNLTNKLTKAPRSGELGNPAITQPGGVPSVSMDMAGVSYDASAGDGGQAVGANPSSMMAAPGQTKQYRYFLDRSMGEGAKAFRSGGDSTQLTLHGLFGALVAEPAGSRWYDPRTGADRTDAAWTNWEAMIRPAAGPAFREFNLLYHEVGDGNFNLRRPLRENDEGIPIGGDPGIPVGDQLQLGRPLPMIDVRPPTPQTPNEGGGGTNVYRPASRAINYRSEPFYRRGQLEAARGADVQHANQSLAFSSYTFGDPSTPMPRSYLGEPTKTRIVHTGVEQLHVHHLHGGGTRWRNSPGDAPASSLGLTKSPDRDTDTIDLDSQTISPMESVTLAHECTAGGCQQAPGDFLFHCHISQHYMAGMWGLWRVFDTVQPDLAPLPDRTSAPTAVPAAGLLGHTVQGRKVVLQSALTDPKTQVALEKLVEGDLPPQGARWTADGGQDPDDATVWDWQKAGAPDRPTYLGEPETTAVWADYRSPTPGARPEILFNPDTGHPAYPMLRPHLGMRPPFAPDGHSGAPYLGDTASAGSPRGICAKDAPVRTYDVTSVPVQFQATAREKDTKGEIYVLNEDKDAVRAGTKGVDPLTIRSNVGDCVAVTLSNELDPAQQAKANMHTHFVQFDPLASDGVVSGFAFEQSIFGDSKEKRTLASTDAADKITVSTVGQLRPGVSIGIGVGRADIEIRTITAITGNQLVFDRPLAAHHAAGEPVTVEFVQYRWFSDVDSGTVFWHDHVDAITSWSHGLFGANVIEPKGSTYHDPKTGQEVRSGTIVDIVNSGGSVGAGQSGSFREFMIFMLNGRRGRAEVNGPFGSELNPFNAGQECEEGTINLRAAPLGERTPPGATPTDPKTTDQRQEYNGSRCRNAFSQAPDIPGNADANTARATISSVDPYVFSSVKYGDPGTPLLRAYAGDPVVIRTIGLSDRAEALRIQGHRFRLERFSPGSQLSDTATLGISERFDYVLDGGAGGPSHSAGDYLYYSTRTFALESGAWGIFRVHDTKQSDLEVLPGRPAPGSGAGFPRQVAAAGNTQATPGPDPVSAFNPDGSANASVVTSTADPCPRGARTVAYDVSLINKALPTQPYNDTGGVIYALTSDVAGIQAGTKPVEPLVLRASKGDCVRITLRDRTTPGSLYGGSRAGLDLAKLAHNQQLSSGAAVGLNPDSTVPVGGAATYAYYADQDLGTTLFQNLGSTTSLRHGAYGMMIVEPKDSTWTDSATDAPLGPNRTSTQAIIRAPGGQRFREFALTMQSTDQQYGRSILPYEDQVAGDGLNSPTAANLQVPPVPGAPPGTADHPGSYDKGYSDVNYHNAPLTQRLGLTANKDDFTKATVVGSYGTAFSSTPYGDPDTPVLRADSGDPVVFRLGIGASDQLHSFTVGGHAFPLDPKRPGSPKQTARTVTAGETLDAWVGPAGGGNGNHGDYLFSDARLPFAEAGMWGILRVTPCGAPGGPAPL